MPALWTVPRERPSSLDTVSVWGAPSVTLTSHRPTRHPHEGRVDPIHRCPSTRGGHLPPAPRFLLGPDFSMQTFWQSQGLSQVGHAI